MVLKEICNYTSSHIKFSGNESSNNMRLLSLWDGSCCFCLVWMKVDGCCPHCWDPLAHQVTATRAHTDQSRGDLPRVHSRGWGFWSTTRELFPVEYLTVICHKDAGKWLCAVIYGGKHLPVTSSVPLLMHPVSPVRLLKFLERHKAKMSIRKPGLGWKAAAIYSNPLKKLTKMNNKCLPRYTCI